MQEHIFFDKAISYTKDMVEEDKEEHLCKNLSTLLFVYSKKFFELNNLIDLNKIIAIYSENGTKYEIMIQPDIQDMAYSFGYSLENIEVSTTTELVQKLGEYKETCIKLLYDIETFYKNRTDVLMGKNIRFLSPYDGDKDKEILDLISNIQEILPSISRQVIDYEYGSTHIQSQILEDLYALSNYELLRNFCKEYSKECKPFQIESIPDVIENLKEKSSLESKINSGDIEGTQYWEAQETISELEEDINYNKNIINAINTSPFYKREFFAMLYIALEDVVEKEEALNNFIFKIINNELKTVSK